MPCDTWNRRADSACHEDHGLSFLHARGDEALDEFRRDHLLLLDDAQVTLTRGLAGLVSCDARYDTGVGAIHVCDHQRVIAGLVHEDLVCHVVGDLLAVYVPGHLGIRAAGYATIKSGNRVYRLLIFIFVNMVNTTITGRIEQPWTLVD